jgi:hypothetical protein
MKTLVLTALVVTGFALTASAQTTITVPAPAPVTVTPAPALGPPAKYTGDAWTWDSQRSIVTLHDAGRIFRVQVTPDQIQRLNHHARTTVTGTLLGPEPIDTVIVPAGPMTAQPSGPAVSADIEGQVNAIDGNGVATINSTRGPLRVWLAENAQARFTAGRPVKLHASVQPVRMVAVTGAGGLASGPTLTVTPPIPGDQAVVVGRVIAVSPTGTLSVESPRGPISVWVPDARIFKVGDFVQVQTVVQPG